MLSISPIGCNPETQVQHSRPWLYFFLGSCPGQALDRQRETEGGVKSTAQTQSCCQSKGWTKGQGQGCSDAQGWGQASSSKGKQCGVFKEGKVLGLRSHVRRRLALSFAVFLNTLSLCVWIFCVLGGTAFRRNSTDHAADLEGGKDFCWLLLSLRLWEKHETMIAQVWFFDSLCFHPIGFQLSSHSFR